MVTVSRSRDRFLLFFNDLNVGFIDYVVPYNIFKTPYEVIHLDFVTTKTFPFEGCEWEDDPYPQDNQPLSKYPVFSDMEHATKFYLAHMFNESLSLDSSRKGSTAERA
jgi:hypothetical protein